MYNKWVSCGLRSTAFESHPRPHWTRRARHLCVICSMCSLRIGRFSDKLENENGERPDLRSHTSYESGSCLPACCSNAPMYFGSNFRGGGGGGERVGMPLILSMICLGENVAPGPRGWLQRRRHWWPQAKPNSHGTG